MYAKIHFIREVFWCFDDKKAREDLLKSKTSLGLQNVIASLGFSNADSNLYDSIQLLRNQLNTPRVAAGFVDKNVEVECIEKMEI